MTVLVSAVAGAGGLTLGWADGGESYFPWSWLRDACPCDDCRAGGGRQRTLDVTSIAFPVDPAEVSWTAGTVDVTWADHRSTWPARALHHKGEPVSPPTSGLHRERWPEVQTDEKVLERLLAAVVDHGAALVTGVPAEPGAVLDVVASFGHVRRTNYGELFDVRPVIDPTNLADTAVGLGPHTDNPYRDPVPSIQVLHCLRSTATGGDTVLVDGFEAVGRLEAEAAWLLRTTMWRWCWQDAENYLEATGPVIDAAPDGSLRQIRFNERSRAPSITLLHDPAPALAALAAFARVLADPAGWTTLHLAPGDALIMDNRRVLHARTAFEAAGERWLQGCYSDMDGLRSRLAILRNKVLSDEEAAHE